MRRQTVACASQNAGTLETPAASSPLDRPLGWTEFPDIWAKSKTHHLTSLRELADRIRSTSGGTKNDLPWLKLGEFGNQAKERTGCLRHDANLLFINGIELDYDDGDLTWDHAWLRLYTARLPALLYTTARHTADKPRFRILLPTSQPLSPDERAQLVARAYGVLRGKIDGASFGRSQSYYFGCVAGGRIWLELIDPPNGRYIDLAHDLDAGALDKLGQPYGSISEDDRDDDGDDDDAFPHEPDLERIRDALESIPAEEWDKRELWLSIGQALHHEFDGSEDGFGLWDEASQRSGKYDTDDQRRVWESFGSFVGKPVTIGTLFRLAKELSRKPETIAGQLRFLTTEECRLAPSRGYVVKGLLAPGNVACIFGAPGAGKSLIGPHVAMQVALGEPAFGMRIKPGGVFYVAAEDPDGMKRRVAALAIRQGDAPLFRLVEGVSDLYREGSPDLDALLEAVEDNGPALIIIDTLARAFPGLEENDAKSMGRVVTVARQLAAHGAAVMLIHHDTKAEGSTPRGHSSFNGDLDVALHLKRDGDGVVRAQLTKNRNGTPDRDIAFRISAEELGTDEDGDPITAPFVEELKGREAAMPKKLPASQREALAILEELEAQGAVQNEQWAEACTIGFRVSQSEDRKSRQKAFGRARTALAEAGLIEIAASGDVRSKSPWDDELTSSEAD